MTFSLPLPLPLPLLLLAVLSAGLSSAGLSYAAFPTGGASPSPPAFNTSSMIDWKYTGSDGTVIGHYRFYYWFDADAPDEQLGDLVRFQNLSDPRLSIIRFRNYTALEETNVVFDAVTGACCVDDVPHKTHQPSLLSDMGNNYPLIPSDAKYVGQRYFAGDCGTPVLADGWRFTWSQDDKPVRMNVVRGLTETRPYRLELPHNGRYITYDEYQPSRPDVALWTESLLFYQKTCSTQARCPFAPPTVGM